MSSFVYATPGHGSQSLTTLLQSSETETPYFPLTPEEVTLDSEASRDQVMEEVTPCFPLTPDELYLDSSPPLLADINSCFSLEEMNLCCPHDQTLRELNLCSPVTPGDGDPYCSPHTPADVAFSCSSPQTPEASLSSSPVTPAVVDPASFLTSSDSVSGSSVSSQPTGLLHCSNSPAEDLNVSSPQSPSWTVDQRSPRHVKDMNSRSTQSRRESTPQGSENPPGEFSPPATKPKPAAEFLTMHPSDLLLGGQSQQPPPLMPSRRVDPTSTSTPYTDAAQARKPARQGHIKRPMNAFMIWAQQQRHQIIAQYPGSDNAKISKFLGSAWKKMSDTEKAPYREEADRLKQLHVKEFPEYKYKPRKAAKRKPLPETENDLLVETKQTSSVKRKPQTKPKTPTTAAAACAVKTGSRTPRCRSREKASSHKESQEAESAEQGTLASKCQSLTSLLQAVSPHQQQARMAANTSSETSSSAKKTFLGVVTAAAAAAAEVKDVQKQVMTADGFRNRSNEVTGSVRTLTSSTGALTSLKHIHRRHPSTPNIGADDDDDDGDDDDNDDNSSSEDNENVTDSGEGTPGLPSARHVTSSKTHVHPDVLPKTLEDVLPKTLEEDVLPKTSATTGTEKTPPRPCQPRQEHPHPSADDVVVVDVDPGGGSTWKPGQPPQPPPRAHSQNSRVDTSSPCDASEGQAASTEDALSSSYSSCSSYSSSSSSSASSDPGGLQELTFSEDELEQLFATTADEGAFLNLVKYVIC
ncbi:uncharacterized protein LOC143294792 [Babylonia areolata]|uniref:uncharacterized protein LOC143294792 n=1 Tax=Babylonia areolata TaxID=304850 RepID=UPI003FD22C8D